MFFSCLDLRVLIRSTLGLVESALRLTDHVDTVGAVLVLLDDCPIGVVRADRCVDFELVGKLHEEFDVLA